MVLWRRGSSLYGHTVVCLLPWERRQRIATQMPSAVEPGKHWRECSKEPVTIREDSPKLLLPVRSLSIWSLKEIRLGASRYFVRDYYTQHEKTSEARGLFDQIACETRSYLINSHRCLRKMRMQARWSRVRKFSG